jgi:hypothetical protein
VTQFLAAKPERRQDVEGLGTMKQRREIVEAWVGVEVSEGRKNAHSLPGGHKIQMTVSW